MKKPRISILVLAIIKLVYCSEDFLNHVEQTLLLSDDGHTQRATMEQLEQAFAYGDRVRFRDMLFNLNYLSKPSNVFVGKSLQNPSVIELNEINENEYSWGEKMIKEGIGKTSVEDDDDDNNNLVTLNSTENEDMMNLETSTFENAQLMTESEFFTRNLAVEEENTTSTELIQKPRKRRRRRD